MSLRILTGKWKGQTLISVKAASTRPTTSMLRQAVFNIWSEKIESAHFLDLFAGSGAMGFEALSLGAGFVTWVESHSAATRIISQNIEKFACQANSKLWPMRVELYLKRQETCFDLIFVDPPYDWKAALESAQASNHLASDSKPGHYVRFLAQTLAFRLKPKGELMIEQDRHVEEAIGVIEGLQLVETRQYGDSLLHRFVKT